ncbi:fungal transcriptional regulatory protein [Diplocarpon rosae]|nr:fungal transcriptional regulatory protein [Diplocarpon rosae]
MTLPLACPPPALSSSPPTGAQRKRRRRAPASGALDDCFACTKRGIKCDRRRPYCSPCLEVGNECSGYKTQLTWGVGVASRGKLRGLSLPVARSAPAPRSPPTNRPRAKSTVTTLRDEENIQIKISNVEAVAPIIPSPFTTYDLVHKAPNSMAPQMHISEWEMLGPHDYPLQDYPPPQDAMGHNQRHVVPQLNRLHALSLGRVDGLSLGPPLDSMSSYAESDFASPMSQSFPPDDAAYMHSPLPIYNSYSSSASLADSPISGMMGDSRGPTSCPDPFYTQSELSSSISSHQNQYDMGESRQHQPSSGLHEQPLYDDDMLGGLHHPSDPEMYATSARSSHFGWASLNDDDARSQTASEPDPYNLAGLDSVSSSYTSETPPRVSFFLDYYEKIICPSVVFIDSPSNPYRAQILGLASTSHSLQHAICALAACNLRMKRKQSLDHDPWRLAPFELDLHDRGNHGGSRPVPIRRPSSHPISPEIPSMDASVHEEYQHRTLAVHLLNQQLSDPQKARHDCVLATLFILCHYRMCESGVAQFRTQFAGIKKILGMRDSGVESGNWGWMETLFTFYDGIVASINDREAQLRGGYLEMIANPGHPQHALENLAGCDSGLFKIIGRLGRLNMLSQHRPVLDPAGPPGTENRRPMLPQPRPGLAGQALANFYNLHAHNFDGNGFASTLDDDTAFAALASNFSHDDLRTTFWTEWKAARVALQGWEFDPSRLMATLPVTPSPTQLRDFGYISEAFRYAALLYTERLAFPHLPSSHLNFQNLVSQVLNYVTSLDQDSGAEKFLLWPLFISGSECVNELQQNIVRTKCREIMARSGYLNNLAGQEVLEKLWAETEDHAPGNDFGPPFRWTKVMEGSGGEWIMV